MIPTVTPEQKTVLEEQRIRHTAWLSRTKIQQMGWGCGEAAYTGLIFSALVDPASRVAVCRALLNEPAPTRPVSSRVKVRWPSSGVDLIVEYALPRKKRVILLEHKRFRSPSHAPGYRRNRDADWQTDQVYEATQGAEAPGWLDGFDPDADRVYLVLDVHGKSMEQMYPEGRHNSAWRVTSYHDFGRSLRASHIRGVGGLVPLLSCLYSP